MNTKAKNSEYKLFNKLSEEWWNEDGKFKVLHQIRPLRIKYIKDQIGNKDLKNLDILDLGCGGGLVSESLSRLGARVTGIDFVENNIRAAKLHAKKNKLHIKYYNEDIENLLIKKKYDVIILFEILEHLNDWKKLLYKIKKNLNKNGIIIISTINRNLISKYAAIYFAENILKWIPKGTHSFQKFIKPDELKKFMKKNNYKFKDLTGLIFNPVDFNWKLSSNITINYFCTFSNIN